MIFSVSCIALVASLTVSAAPAPYMGKRYSGALIKSRTSGACLSLQGNNYYNDQIIIDTPCSVASRWNIDPGSGSITPADNSGFAIDAGENPHNNVRLKIYQSYPGAIQQTWYLTNDNRIAITGGDQCMDQGDVPQTYQCTPGNTNQVWDIGYGNSVGFLDPPTTTYTNTNIVGPTKAQGDGPPAPTTTGSAPTSGSYQQIRWKSDESKCLGLTGTPDNDVAVSLVDCNNPVVSGGNYFIYQGDGEISTGIYGQKWCLDAGSNPANGIGLKAYACGGYAQQTWETVKDNYFNPKNRYTDGVFRTANNQCIDIDNSDYKRVQTWTCSESDANQQFVLRNP